MSTQNVVRITDCFHCLNCLNSFTPTNVKNPGRGYNVENTNRMKKTYGVLSIQKQNRNDGTKIPRKSDISPPKKSGGAHACMYDVYMGTHLARVWIPSPARGQLKREESEY